MTDLLERKATTGVLPDEEETISNLAWAIYSGTSTYPLLIQMI